MPPILAVAAPASRPARQKAPPRLIPVGATPKLSDRAAGAAACDGEGLSLDRVNAK